ncbi:MAG: chitobiase/beta-hexosaminidase C-terminal domain-containing protein [Bacteroidales bacterium]|nr:chitobiase/beta-hexosaminidase C-terminal domain-containing protein [Bacteroidales bacterium]
MIQKTVHRSTSKRSTDLLRRLLRRLALAAFLLLPAALWAQDLSGTYYIASNDNSAYYLCPSTGSLVYATGQPYLTTYQTGQVSGSVWRIVKDEGSGYYHIIHAADDLYLTHNVSLTNDASRLRVHLQSSLDGNNSLFKVEQVAGQSYYIIEPMTVSGSSLNPAGNNYNNYAGTNDKTAKINGTTVNVGGLIGLWASTDARSKWLFSDATIAPPAITNNGDGTVTITTETGAAIYYTLDGTTPTTSTLTGGTTSVTVALTESTEVVKAIAKSPSDDFPTIVKSYALPRCATPVITVSAGTVTITCATGGASIYYTNDDTEATLSATNYNNTPFSIGTAPVIRAIAAKAGYAKSEESFYYDFNTVHSSDEMTNMRGAYLLASDFTSSAPIGTSLAPFRGIIDGQMNTLSNLSHPLVAYADGATIRNVILSDVTISGGTNAGAICNEATGASRIYNCGVLGTLTETKDAHGNITSISSTSTVSGSGYVGSIVGLLDGTSRVINCYSFATVSGGTMAAGIVGNNNQASTQSNLKTIVVNCMFYGDITGGTSKYPVYGGNSINNDASNGINPYCYFRKNATFTPTGYNRSWPAEEKNLTRFEYYRSILNSNRRLCTWWVNGTDGTAPTDDDVKEVGIAKWVLDPSIAPYPILKEWGKYPSVINPDTTRVWDPRTEDADGNAVVPQWVLRNTANEWEGKSYNTLTVTVKPGSHNSSAADVTKHITITDMDTLNHDYGYYKIQLPYYNEVFGNPNGATHTAKYGNNYTDQVVTGWKITAVNKHGKHPFTAAWEDGYNFADRQCTGKDLYDTSSRVFAQGGYYYVPDGVTAITIEAYWGKAVYLANRGYSIDRVNVTNADYKSESAFTSAGAIANTFHEQTVYDDLQNAIKALGESSSYPTVYDQAIVLIGNHQVKNGGTNAGDDKSIGYNLDNKWHPFTIMSVDLDFDNEPDHCLQFQFRENTHRPGIQPVRFDFLPIIELGLAVRHNKLAYAIGVFIPQGHFEITETAFMRLTQFEWDCGQDGGNNRIANNVPVILNGGEFDQLSVRYNNGNRTGYFLLGGHLWFHRFAPGTHPNITSINKAKARLCAVNAIGGDYPEFYLSGLYRADITPRDDQGNPHCYIDGGRFGSVYGAGYEKIKGSVTFKVNHALITEFYGGGINGSNPVGGNIDVTIDNSRVTKYCGGPKVGDMTGKTVTTHATGTTFDVFFGGGNGGNSYYRQLQKDGDEASTHIGTWTNNNYNWNGFVPLGVFDDGTDNKGYHAEYEFEVFNQSNGVTDQITQRGFINWIQFGLTKTGDVSNSLTDCIINTNFYGGGNLGTVDGDVTSSLTNCTVGGSAFGAGYSAAIPTFQVHDKNNAVFPSMDDAGTITDGHVGYGSEVYEWTNDLNGMSEEDRKASPTYSKVVEGETKWYCYTWNSLEDLGTVTGSATLTLNGTTVGTLVAGVLQANTGNVYGGGEESKVSGNTNVVIRGTTLVHGSVFGAGKGVITDTNMARVGGDSKVTMAAGTVKQNIYGGGELSMVDGDAHVQLAGGMIGLDDPESTDGFVFGGGKGTIFDPLFATVKGNTHVTMSGGTVHNTLFGGGELASVGTFSFADAAYVAAHLADSLVVGEPVSCAANTGRCLVQISGGQVGHKNATLLNDIGYVFGAGMGVYTDPHAANEPVASATNACFGYVNTAEVQISADAFIVGAVWGGSENGQVLDSCGVVVSGGQIGCGYDWANERGLDPYTSTQWTNAINAVKTQNATNINSMAAEMPECHHWPYGRDTIIAGNPTKHYLPYDPYARMYGATDASEKAGDGHTFFGNVFGGGSGYYAYLTDDGAGGYTAKWYRFQGRVRGNSYVVITGGHILTSVYGGCEYGDVLGTSRVEMSGGTLGVPRTLDSILDHPVTCYLFGAGKGDQRTEFNLLTNVRNVNVKVTGGVIFGSVFGGSEDGNVFGDIKVSIEDDVWIGTWGTSYVDGNIFGAGRGFSGVSQTSGSVGGNVQVDIKGGRMLGSVFGGGRMASVGTYFAAVGDANYGVLQPDDGVNHHGEIHVNVTGGTIGNDAYRANPVESTWTGHIVSGNVFGGGMGRYDKSNTIWPLLGRAKRTFVTINGAGVNIQGNVYGGGEIGCIEEDASVQVQAGTIYGSVYGGGFGSQDDEEVNTILGFLSAATLAGRVEGNASVAVSGGWIKENVYGGGEIATVGHITDSVKHEDLSHSFHLSWPYRMTYAPGTGTTAVSVTGGRIGISGKDALEGTGGTRIDNGDVYGAGKGLASSRYHEAHLSNVNNSSVSINFTYNDYATTEEIAAAPSNHQLIAGSVYGGAENGHVIGNTSVTFTNGLIGHNIYGGGKGKGEYVQTKLKHLTDGDLGKGEEWSAGDDSTATIYSVTAGRVYGNTSVTMSGGHVIRNVFGGGNQGSVGVGNFAGGGDDYSAAGYGEKVAGNTRPDGLTDADAEYYYNYWSDTVNRGRCTVSILGGTVGTPAGDKDDLPTGNVFGACRGQAPRWVSPTLTNRWWYVPEYYLGYINTSYVTIGDAADAIAAPTIYGSVYGGAQDGHVRNSTTVVINEGTIGLEPTAANKTAVGEDDLSHYKWATRGNVFGAGSGIGLYDSDKDGVADSYNNASGSVTKFTTVTINGGTIHQNVYGGGNLGTVGQPCINCGGVLPTKAQSLSTVVIGDDAGTLTATIGSATGLASSYGGNVYGSSRGMLKATDEASDDSYASTTYTQVDIRQGAYINGSVFGGGENGFVRRATEVNVTGGTVGIDVYGGGQGAYKQTVGLVTYNNDVNSGRVGESTEVNILGGTVGGDVYGGAKASFVLGGTTVNIGHDVEGVGVGTATIAGEVFGANNLAGTPRGNTAVHIYSTAHSGTNVFPSAIATLVAPVDEVTSEDLDVNDGSQTYALRAVYGGGNLAAHDPTEDDGTTLVHIHYCEQNTVENVYGGGNAADTKNNHIIIDGGRVRNVYGGGNGYSSTGNHTHPFIMDGETPTSTPDPNYNPGADVSGTATTEIHGGIVNNVFGGSNQKGTIGNTVLITDAESGCDLQLTCNSYGGGSEADGGGGEIILGCGTKFENFYAGSRNADIVGDIHLIIKGGEYKNVFGGSKGTAEDAADITGNVTVDVYGGSIENLYGGSDVNGRITGSITVNVDWTDENTCDDAKSIDYVYGGGNQAAYTPAEVNHEVITSPVVNIINATINKAVFGGGYGIGATVTANPKVVIGADRTKNMVGNAITPVSDLPVTIGTALNPIGATLDGDVFGGGNAAQVVGNTSVIVKGASTTVYNNVYGGGNAATVTGNTDIQIGH